MDAHQRVLVGKQMGQLHVDFTEIEFEEKAGSKMQMDPVAVQSLFLGKKCYIDVLQAECKGITKQKHHYRMKGTSETALQCHCENYYNGDMLELHKDLMRGKSMKTCLNPTDHTFKWKCETTGTRTMNMGEFTRTVKF